MNVLKKDTTAETAKKIKKLLKDLGEKDKEVGSCLPRESMELLYEKIFEQNNRAILVETKDDSIMLGIPLPYYIRVKDC